MYYVMMISLPFKMRVDHTKNQLRDQGFSIKTFDTSNPDERFKVGSLEELTKVAKSFNQTAIYVTPVDWGAELFAVDIVTCKSETIVAAKLGECSETRHSEIDYKMWDEAGWWELYGTVGAIVMCLIAFLAGSAILQMRTHQVPVGNTPSKEAGKA